MNESLNLSRKREDGSRLTLDEHCEEIVGNIFNETSFGLAIFSQHENFIKRTMCAVLCFGHRFLMRIVFTQRFEERS